MEFERLVEIITDVMNYEGAEITMDTSFKDDIGADSLDLMEIVMQIEDELDVQVPDEVLADIVTVGDAMRMIQSQ